LAAGYEAQRFEAARAWIVVLEEKAIDVEAREQSLRDRVVSAFGVPAAAAVAAAHVDRNRDALAREPRKCRVVAGDGRVELGVRIAARRLHLLAVDGIEIVRVERRVELDVGDALANEPADFIANDRHQIAEQFGPV